MTTDHTTKRMRPHQRPDREPCAIEGCDRKLYAKAICVMHYSRLRNGLGIGPVESLRAAPGEGSINPDGYVVHGGQWDHPLAGAQGKLLEHRAVLYDTLGPGSHPCHWCGKPLSWTASRQSRKIQADHLDHNRTNNAAENLVPACLDCNTKRTTKPVGRPRKLPVVARG